MGTAPAVYAQLAHITEDMIHVTEYTLKNGVF
jgi:hypothetical protein